MPHVLKEKIKDSLLFFRLLKNHTKMKIYCLKSINLYSCSSRMEKFQMAQGNGERVC